MMKIIAMLLLFVATVSFAQTGAPITDMPEVNFIDQFINGIPVNTITWILVIFAMLNALSVFLTKMAELTKNQSVSKVAHVFADCVYYLSMVVNFVVAKGKNAPKPVVAPVAVPEVPNTLEVETK